MAGRGYVDLLRADIMNFANDSEELFNELATIREVKRYADNSPAYAETVAEHCFVMTMYAVELASALQLKKLDMEKVIRLCLYHDICELHMEADYGAVESQDPITRQKKTSHETENICRLTEKYGEWIGALWNEYNAAKTPEARLVKALDKIESNFHIINRGAKYLTPKEAEFTSRNPIASVKKFPALSDFYREWEKVVEREFKAVGHCVEFPVFDKI